MDKQPPNKDSQELENTFLGLAETIPASIYILQGNRFCYINSRMELLSGYNREELLNMNFWEMAHIDFRDLIKTRGLARQHGENPPSQYEFKILTKDGREIWVEHLASRIIYKGRPAVLAAVYDITDRKKNDETILNQHNTLQDTYIELEEIHSELQSSQDNLIQVNSSLRKSENRYRTLIETIPEIVAHIDIKGNYIWVNGAGKDFFGSDVCEHHFRDYFVHREDYRQTLKMVAPLLQDSDEIIVLETLFRRADSEVRLLRWQSKTLKEDGKIIGTLSTARDTTEMKEAEIKLKASEERYRNLFENSPIGLIKVNQQMNITDANKYYIDIVGAPSKEAVTSLNLLAEASKRADISAGLNHILEHFPLGQSLSEEMQFLSNWGKPVKMRLKIDPVFDAQGNMSEAIVACEEISEAKKAEERIRFLSYNDALTGVYNRAFLDEELRRLDVPRQLPLTIIIGDVNGLKLVNDAFGHQIGDKLLVTIARILKSTCRAEDIIARWGGDEFFILLPKTTARKAYNICERIRAACLETIPNPIQPSIALGAACKKHPDEDIYKTISEAEDIMYRNKLLESKSIRNSIICSLETTLHEKTFETTEHAQRMQKLCMKFGKVLRLPGNELDRLSLLANLHDIGKIGIPDKILCKTGPLSNDEWIIIKQHPEIGFRIVYSSHELVAIADEVLAHHEKWDGSGYPAGLAGNDIPLLARILAIVDSYDVMTHERSYKKAISHVEALNEIIKCAETHFDPYLVEEFKKVFEEQIDAAVS